MTLALIAVVGGLIVLGIVAFRRGPMDGDTFEGVVRRAAEMSAAREGVEVIEASTTGRTVRVTADGGVTTMRIGERAVIILPSEEARQERERRLLAKAVVDEIERRGMTYR